MGLEDIHRGLAFLAIPNDVVLAGGHGVLAVTQHAAHLIFAGIQVVREYGRGTAAEPVPALPFDRGLLQNRLDLTARYVGQPGRRPTSDITIQLSNLAVSDLHASKISASGPMTGMSTAESSVLVVTTSPFQTARRMCR